MKRIFLSTLLSLATISSANAMDNYYVNIGGGWAFPNHNGSTSTNSSLAIYSPSLANPNPGLYQLTNLQWQSHYNSGAIMNVALGAALNNNWRGEAEFLYEKMTRKITGSYNWVERSAVGGADSVAPQFGLLVNQTSSKVNSYTLMGNILYDFKNNSKLTPFLGFGIGVATLHSKSTTTGGAIPVNDLTQGTQFNNPTANRSPGYSASAFAGQLKAGLGIQLTKHLTIAGQYRLFATTPFPTTKSLITVNPGAPNQAIFTGKRRTISSLVSNGFDINLRYTV